MHLRENIDNNAIFLFAKLLRAGCTNLGLM